MNTPIVVLLSRKGAEVHAVGCRATVEEAVCEMSHHNIGSVAVVENGRLVGLLTERDVLARVVAAGRQPDLTFVADVMTRNPATLSSRATVEDAMSLFTEQRCRQLPVMDPETDRMVGIISIGDVNRWLVEMQRTEMDHLRQYIAGDHSG